MSRKRSVPDCYRNNKRMLLSHPHSESGWNGENDDDANFARSSACTDTKAALLYLKTLFPVDRFEGRLPCITFQHQLYSILKNRTVVDKELGDMRESCEIRLFHIGPESNIFCVVFTEDYKSHVLKFTSDLVVNSALIHRFLSSIVSQCPDVSLTKQKMADLKFTDSDITELINACVLTVRDVGSWWLAIPSAGLFMRNFLAGRRAMLAMIRKAKYREVLQKELETRKMPKSTKLGVMYHLHDIIGADLVDSINTTSGPLLRLT